ncbi:MAG: hypothetical protein ACKEQK_00525, partial [Candidatus Hodgkinia cicadicola]
MSLLKYCLNKIKYSPKKMRVLAKTIKGNIISILLTFKYDYQLPVRHVLVKFFSHVYRDIVIKYPWVSIIEIVECYIGRCGIKRTRKFAARGRIVFISSKRSNLTVLLAL